MIAPRAASASARVLICDDSAVTRNALFYLLSQAPGIEVVARVADGQAALDAVRVLNVDVVVLDIEMPGMDGLTALPLLLAAAPGIAVIMASSLTTRGAEISLRALRLGAADALAKPSSLSPADDQRFGQELVARVLGLARLGRRGPSADAAGLFALRPMPTHRPRLLAIGSSTGGPAALFTLLAALPPSLPVPVVITQHMPAAFLPILAGQITRLGKLPCAVARDGDTLRPGHILLAPGERHLMIHKQGDVLVAEVSDTPPEQFCRPAVDPMLRSACAALDGRVLVAMLTGMGQDGLAGARAVVEAGGGVVAQDEATSVVWGMPGAVVKAGLACAVLPLPRIAPMVQAMLGSGA